MTMQALVYMTVTEDEMLSAFRAYKKEHGENAKTSAHALAFDIQDFCYDTGGMHGSFEVLSCNPMPAWFSLLSTEERASLVWPMTTDLRQEAAMVLWEFVYELAFLFSSNINPILRRKVRHHHDKVGAVEMRHEVMKFVEPLHVAWHVANQSGEIVDAFDWEFTPWFVQNCLNWTSDAEEPKLDPQWLTLARQYHKTESCISKEGA